MTTEAASAQELVRVSGRGTTVNFEIDDSVPLEAACRALREHLGRERALYASGKVTADIGRRILFDDHQARIRKVIESESGLTVSGFRCRPEILEQQLRRINELLAAQEPRSKRPSPDDSGSGPAAPEAGFTLGGGRSAVPAQVAHGTCRSGEVLEFPGNAVVLGNVNPGGQVIAGGDILVFGGLRGFAHAGAGGDATAIILAMSVASPILRIAGYSWQKDDARTGPVRRSSDGMGPTIARVRNGSVHVAPYLKNYSIDHGGNPHER